MQISHVCALIAMCSSSLHHTSALAGATLFKFVRAVRMCRVLRACKLTSADSRPGLSLFRVRVVGACPLHVLSVLVDGLS
jgi:hypothetical protein